MKRGNDITANSSLAKLEDKNIQDHKTRRVSAVSSITISKRDKPISFLSKISGKSNFQLTWSQQLELQLSYDLSQCLPAYHQPTTHPPPTNINLMQCTLRHLRCAKQRALRIQCTATWLHSTKWKFDPNYIKYPHLTTGHSFTVSYRFGN